MVATAAGRDSIVTFTGYLKAFGSGDTYSITLWARMKDGLALMDIEHAGPRVEIPATAGPPARGRICGATSATASTDLARCCTLLWDHFLPIECRNDQTAAACDLFLPLLSTSNYKTGMGRKEVTDGAKSARCVV